MNAQDPDRSESPEPATRHRHLVEKLSFELVPTRGVTDRLDELPAASTVSITCSPVKGVDATLDLAERVAGRGHRPVPHLAARMVRSETHLREIVARLAALGGREVFVIAGDADSPVGPYHDALSLLSPLLHLGADRIEQVGVAAYPDGHPLIDLDTLRRSLHAKQALLAEAGVGGRVTTQMCFAAATIRSWLEAERAAGLTLPVNLGVAGAVDRRKLLAMGVAVGVGTSMRYLKKNRSALGRLVTSARYNPSKLIDAMTDDLVALDIAGLHIFTFNQVAATLEWRDRVLRRLQRS